jgi:hypothetical protein
MSHYGDHSYLHEHGPGGFWEGRESERPSYSCNPAYPENPPSFSTPQEQADREAKIKILREKLLEETKAQFSQMTDPEILKFLIKSFDLDYRSNPGSDSIRGCISRLHLKR